MASPQPLMGLCFCASAANVRAQTAPDTGCSEGGIKSENGQLPVLPNTHSLHADCVTWMLLGVVILQSSIRAESTQQV